MKTQGINPIKYISTCLIAGWIACCCTLWAQTTPRNLLSKYSVEEIAQALIPLSQWKPFPRAATEWQQILPDSLRRTIIDKAEQYATLPFESLPASLMLQYVRTGDRSNYEAISFGKRERLFVLALAEAIEHKGRFTDGVVDGIWSICEESFWGVPAHIGLQKAGVGLADVEDPVVDLFNAETAAALALTDYLAGSALDSVSPLLRKRIYFEVNRRVLVPLEKDSKRYWYFGENPNNWNPWITSNWMISLLLLEKNEQRRATELHHAMTLTDIYLNKLGDDGAVDEGPGYWFDAVARLFDGLNIIESATGGRISLFKENFIRLLASYIYKTHIGGNYFVSIADAYPILYPDGIMLYRFGKAVNDTTLQNFGAFFFQRGGNVFDSGFTMADRLWNFTEIKSLSKNKGNEPLLRDVWLKSIELMIARTDKGLFVAAHGGHNAESHNHNDVGDFIIYADGKPIIIDVGSGTYTSKTFSKDRYTLWYNTSAYHNLPSINGIQQQAGRQFEARDVAYTSNSERARLKMDITRAYPVESGLVQWIRIIDVEKKKNNLIVKDSFIADTTLEKLTQTFMTTCETDIKVPGKIIFNGSGTKVLLEYDAAKWDVSKKEALTHSPDEKKLVDNWGKRPIWRVLLTCKKPSAKDNFTYTFRKIEAK
jgi:hypothetical protein